MISIYVIYDTDCHYFRRLPGTKQTLSRIGQSTHRWGRKGLLPQGHRSSAKLQAYNDRAHHCHSKHLLLLNIRVAPPTISRTPTTGTTPGRQSNCSSLDTLRGAGVVGVRRRGGPSSPGAPCRQDALKRIPATRLPGPCYSGRGC